MKRLRLILLTVLVWTLAVLFTTGLSEINEAEYRFFSGKSEVYEVAIGQNINIELRDLPRYGEWRINLDPKIEGANSTQNKDIEKICNPESTAFERQADGFYQLKPELLPEQVILNFTGDMLDGIQSFTLSCEMKLGGQELTVWQGTFNINGDITAPDSAYVLIIHKPIWNEENKIWQQYFEDIPEATQAPAAEGELLSVAGTSQPGAEPPTSADALKGEIEAPKDEAQQQPENEAPKETALPKITGIEFSYGKAKDGSKTVTIRVGEKKNTAYFVKRFTNTPYFDAKILIDGEENPYTLNLKKDGDTISSWDKNKSYQIKWNREKVQDNYWKFQFQITKGNEESKPVPATVRIVDAITINSPENVTRDMLGKKWTVTGTASADMALQAELKAGENSYKMPLEVKDDHWTAVLDVDQLNGFTGDAQFSIHYAEDDVNEPVEKTIRIELAKLTVYLKRENEEPRELITEGDNDVPAGQYTVVVSAGNTGAITWQKPGDEGWNGLDKPINIAANDEFHIVVRENDHTIGEYAVRGMVTERIQITEAPASINIESKGDALNITGTAEPKAKLRWTLEFSVGGAEPVKLTEGELDVNDSGEWECVPSASLDDLEGQLIFRVGYAEKQFVNSDISAQEAQIKIDTNAPMLSMRVGYGEQEWSVTETEHEFVEVKREGAPLYVVLNDDERIEITEALNDGRIAVSGEGNVTTLTCHVTDEADNASQPLEATIKLYDKIEITKTEPDNEWLNLDMKGKDFVIHGTATPNEKLTATFGTDNPKPIMSKGNGEWSVSVPIAEGMEKVSLSVRYADERLEEEAQQRWNVDMVPPAAPEIVLSENCFTEVSGHYALSGSDVTVNVRTEEDDNTLALKITGQDKDDLIEQFPYTFAPQSGVYSLVAQATDPAGNTSEPKSLTLNVVRKIELQGMEAGKLYNANDLADGIELTVLVDDTLNVDVTCAVDGQAVDGDLTDGAYHVPLDELRKRNINNNGPVSLTVSASYRDLPEQFADEWQCRYDVWAPEVKINCVRACAVPQGSSYRFFDGEDVGIRVAASDSAKVRVKANGLILVENDEATVRFMADTMKPCRDLVGNHEQTDGDWYIYKDVHADALKFSVEVSDEAGNTANDSYVMNRCETVTKIGQPTVEGKITPDGKAVITGKTAQPYYYLESDDLPGRVIPADNKGVWGPLELGRDDVPEGKRQDKKWTIKLKYPGAQYTDSVEAEVELDLVCKLDVVTSPKEGDREIQIHTSPNAELSCLLGSGEIGKAKADEAGEARIVLVEPLKKGSVYTVYAEADGYEPAEKNISVGEGEAPPIEDVELTQVDPSHVNVTGKAGADLLVTAKVKGESAGREARADEDGRFAIKGVEIAGEEAEVVIRYRDVYSGYSVSCTVKLDREPPKLTFSEEVLYDVGGSFTVNVDEDATVTVTGDGMRDVTHEVAAETPKQITIEGMLTADALKLTAMDKAGNSSEPVEIPVQKAPVMLAGFADDMPKDGENLYGKGQRRVTAWVAAQTAEPKRIGIVVEQNGKRVPLEPVTVVPEDDRLREPAFKAAMGVANVSHCWRVEGTLALDKLGKGAVDVEVRLDDAVLARRQWIVAVDNKRLISYSVFSGILLLMLGGCVFGILALNRRIRQMNDGRVNPWNKLTNITERSQKEDS